MRGFFLGLAAITIPILASASTYHSITIDGINDFAADETFTTSSSSSGYESYLTWDSQHIFIGYSGTDIGTTDGTRSIQVYIDVDPQPTPTSGDGSTIGMEHSTQQPTLPFAADYHFTWTADGSMSGTSTLWKWNGSAWAAGTFSGLSSRNTTYAEIAMPLADLGDPNQMYIAAFMIADLAEIGWTFAGTPFDAITDGDDPDVLHFLGYNLFSGIAPNATGHDVSLATILFADGFESENVCQWSSFSVQYDCTETAEFATDLTTEIEGQPASLCLERGEGTSGGIIDYVYCGGAFCDDGVTEGCTLILRFTGTSVDPVSLGGSAAFTIDDATLGLEISSSITGSQDCDLLLTNASGFTNWVITLGAACSMSYEEVKSVDALVAGDFDLTAENCEAAILLNTMISAFKSTLVETVEDSAESGIEQKILNYSAGRWICP